MADKKTTTKVEKTEKVETITEPTEGTAPSSDDIDTRMADLLKDHQRMGARPK